MLLAAQVFPTNLHNLTAESNGPGCTISDPVRVVSVSLEVVAPDPHFEIDSTAFLRSEGEPQWLKRSRTTHSGCPAAS